MTTLSVAKHDALQVEIRHIALRQPLEWLSRGWDDVREIGKPGLAHGLLIALLGAVLLVMGSTHLYLTAAAVTGYLLVGPVMTTGLCELARRREAREPLGFDESLQALTRNPDGLLQFRAEPRSCAVGRPRHAHPIADARLCRLRRRARCHRVRAVGSIGAPHHRTTHECIGRDARQPARYLCESSGHGGLGRAHRWTH